MEFVRRQYMHYDVVSRVTKITIPVAPISINTLYSIYKGRKLLTKSGRKWRAKVDPILAGCKVTYMQPVSVAIQTWPSAKRKYDIDNCSKAILDALQRAGIIEDDDLVYRLDLEKHDKHKTMPDGEIWVNIAPYTPRP